MNSERLLNERLSCCVRYNAELCRRGPDDLGLRDGNSHEVQKLNRVKNIADPRRTGQAVARDVTAQHFAGFVAGPT